MQDDTFLECARCGQVKPVDAFPFARTAPGSSRRDTECKDCINARARDYYARMKVEEPEKWRDMMDRKNLMRRSRLPKKVGA
jgi:hypothetical protein